MRGLRGVGLASMVGITLLCLQSAGQQTAPEVFSELNSTGRIVLGGLSTPYLIRRLPVSSFPELPAAIQEVLNQRGCMIPQTYQAHRPENVIHASLKRSGSTDWAMLCSTRGTVSLLVFFSEGDEPLVLASAPEKERLEAHGGDGVLGFDWGIDAATPRQVHDAQAGLTPRPALVDHDALADQTLGMGTKYHFFNKGAWVFLDMPEY